MLKAILFDLDDTLLRSSTEHFIKRYMRALEKFMSEYELTEPGKITKDIWTATDILMGTPHPTTNNLDAFRAAYDQVTGTSSEDTWPRFMQFYDQVYPTLGEGISAMPGAREAIDLARSYGLKVAVATNPLFPGVAARHRLEWAGLSDVPFDLVTAMENCCWTKPNQEYYLEVAKALGVEPQECLMVGNDMELDIRPAKAVGMHVYFVTDGEAPDGDPGGPLQDLLPYLRALMAGAG